MTLTRDRGRPSRKVGNSVRKISARITKDEEDYIERVVSTQLEMSKSEFFRRAAVYYAQLLETKKMPNMNDFK